MEGSNGERVEGYTEEPHMELVTLPHNKMFIGVKWVYRVKVKPTGEVAKYKTRLVAKGFLQKARLDYNEVFAPVARIENIRLVVDAATFRCWSLHQLDVKSSFLNGPLEEEVYMCQPPGFEVIGHEDNVCMLKKALYGLKQAHRAWNRIIDCFLLQLSFNKCTIERGVYVRVTAGDLMFVSLYVDDLLVTRRMEFVTTREGIFMHQKRYATDVLKRFHMLDCNSVQTLIDCGIKLEKEGSGKLIDATLFLCNSQLNIAYRVGLISRFVDNPRLSHLLAVKRISRYMKGTLDYGLLFSKHGRSISDEIYGYCDSDRCGDKSDKKIQ
ncbi:Copia protein, partial [Mucuna pruriens]